MENSDFFQRVRLAEEPHAHTAAVVTRGNVRFTVLTARLLLARMSAPDELGWPLLLRACGAHESFIRTHGWADEPARVAEFLLLDRLFQRSVVHALAGGPRRFSELRELLQDVTPRALALALKDLTPAGLVERTVTPDFPPATVYRLTPPAGTLLGPLEQLARAS